MENTEGINLNDKNNARLLAVWKYLKPRNIAPEWQNFYRFYEWAMANKWEPRAVIRKINRLGPASPENCYLDFGDGTSISLDDIPVKGGSKNSPCNQCEQEEYGSCTQYKTCIRYRAWLHRSWQDFQRAAVALYGKTTIE